jgi:hypothetical protein
MYSIYFVLLPLVYAQLSGISWVWSDSESKADELFQAPRMIGLYPQESFIELSRTRDAVFIEFVQKGRNWPAHTSFCRKVLPSAMSQFLHGIELKKIKEFQVFITAEPFMAGCLCYLRLFVSMGFNDINDFLVPSVDQMKDLCEMLEGDQLLIATPGNVDAVSSPTFSEEGLNDLQKAYKYGT